MLTLGGLFAGLFWLLGSTWPWLLIAAGAWLFWHQDGRHNRRRQARATWNRARRAGALQAAADPAQEDCRSRQPARPARAADRPAGQSRADSPQSRRVAGLRRPVPAVFAGPLPGATDRLRVPAAHGERVPVDAGGQRGHADGRPTAAERRGRSSSRNSTFWTRSWTTSPRTCSARMPIGSWPIGASWSSVSARATLALTRPRHRPTPCHRRKNQRRPRPPRNRRARKLDTLPSVVSTEHVTGGQALARSLVRPGRVYALRLARRATRLGLRRPHEVRDAVHVYPHAPRAGDRLHGRRLRPHDRAGRRLPDGAGAGAAERQRGARHRLCLLVAGPLPHRAGRFARPSTRLRAAPRGAAPAARSWARSRSGSGGRCRRAGNPGLVAGGVRRQLSQRRPRPVGVEVPPDVLAGARRAIRRSCAVPRRDERRATRTLLRAGR